MSKKTTSRTMPGPGFVDTMAASQQAHIDQLVQQSRTLQHAVKKLQGELSNEQNRGRQAVQKIQDQWHAERLEWQEGCDTLQACHKLEYLRVVMELEKERQNILKERDLTRMEKLARLQRDFKITMFQAREAELERRIEELDEELKELSTTTKAQMAEKDNARVAALKKVKAEYAQYVAQAETDAKRLVEIEEERDGLQEELGRLREEYAHLKATSDSLSTRLERATLQLDGSRTTIEELQQKNDELNRNIFDLKRQLDKWKSLETKGGEEAEMQRQKRVELDIRVKQLEGRLEQAERKEEELANNLEKERRRCEKAKGAAIEWKEAAEGYEGDVAVLQAQISQLRERLEGLETDLETERAISRPARARLVNPTITDDDGQSEPGEITPPQKKQPSRVKKPPSTAKPKLKTKSSPKTKPSPIVETEAGPSGIQADEGQPSSTDSADEIEEIVELAVPLSPLVEPKRRGKQKARPNGDSVEAEIPAKTRKGKGRAGAKDDGTDESESAIGAGDQTIKKSKGKQKAVDHESDIEGVDPLPKGGKGKSKAVRAVKSVAQTRVRKRKLSPEDVEESEAGTEAEESRKKGKRAGSVAQSTGTVKPRKAKEKEKAASPPDEPPVVVTEVLPKKKRKINIFPPTTQPGSFNFLTEGLDGGLGIPTELSPIKDPQAVPSRSVSSHGSNIQSRLVASITRRR